MTLAIATLAAFIVCATGAKVPQQHSKSTALLSRARSSSTGGSASLNKTQLATATKESVRPPSCIQDTGVSCLSEKCSESRGKTECKIGHCVCSDGCSSLDGVCESQQNIMVASGLRLQNAHWPAFYMMSASMDREVHVGTNGFDPLARFNLYQLPGQGSTPQDFLLVPQNSPSFSISTVHKYHCNDLLEREGSEKQDISMTSSSCIHTWNVQTVPMSPKYSKPPSVQALAIRLSQAPDPKKKLPLSAVTIRGSGKHVSKYWFVKDGSYKVGTRADDPGLGGYWILDPPLAFPLPAYDGPACEHGCSLSVRSAIAGAGVLVAFAVTLFS